MTTNPVRVARRAVREMRRVASLTPPQRDRHVDLIRAVAIAAVVLGHWLSVYVTHDASGFHGRSVLEVVPWTHPLTWLFQVMPLFFLVGGFANAASLTSTLRRGGNGTGWALSRAARLVRPTTVLLCGLAVGALVARALGAAPALVGMAVWLASIPLWFLVAYIGVVFLTPFMHALHRRAGLAVPIVLAVMVGADDVARLAFGVPYVGPANYLLAWLAVHQLGFSMQDGRLPSRPGVALPLAAAGLAALVLLTVAGPYPVSMVGVTGERTQNTAPPTLALLALAVTQTGIALALRERGNRLLRRPGLWTAVVAVNSVIMTLFLWHMTAVVFGVALLYGTGVLPSAAPGSALWLLLRIPWVACLALILAVLVVVFGRFERRAARRPQAVEPVRGVLPAALTVAGAGAVVAGLLGVARAGPGDHGPTGLPPGVLATYLGGAILLALVQRHWCPAPR
ncbi:acyltransferase family protein [Sphaerisporangium perillae]|uniref:acyltransferase family protein n=1 Tax=Sphaerisporangium perillae TaxID=2935860 RepID=UPI00200EA52C|nr:acyltransferase [Sphaerisporangium perillae]